MGREFIGDCPLSGEDPEFDEYETELTIKYIKQECGQPPRGADVQVTWEGHELGGYPVISVVWDDYTIEYPDEYIGKCIEAFEHFDSPEEVHQWYRDFVTIQQNLQELYDRIAQERWEKHARAAHARSKKD